MLVSAREPLAVRPRAWFADGPQFGLQRPAAHASRLTLIGAREPLAVRPRALVCGRHAVSIKARPLTRRGSRWLAHVHRGRWRLGPHSLRFIAEILVTNRFHERFLMHRSQIQPNANFLQ